MEEPTPEEKEYFEKNFKWERLERYVCKICGNFGTPLPYDMFRHYLMHSRIDKKEVLRLME